MIIIVSIVAALLGLGATKPVRTDHPMQGVFRPHFKSEIKNLVQTQEPIHEYVSTVQDATDASH